MGVRQGEGADGTEVKGVKAGGGRQQYQVQLHKSNQQSHKTEKGPSEYLNAGKCGRAGRVRH